MNDNNKIDCDCDFDSQIAMTGVGNNDFIGIYEYNDKIHTSLYCIKGKFLEFVNRESKPYFRHKSNKDHDGKYTEMSEWHKNWQNYFPELTVEKQIGNRRADVCTGYNVLEFQHSKIDKKLINARSFNYCKYNLHWIIDCNNGRIILSNNYITFKELWIYNHFKDIDLIYLDYNDNIYMISPKDVYDNEILIDNNNIKSKEDFIKYILNYDLSILKNEKINVWIYNKTKLEGIIYYNQRGAGCGKTVESIQLIQNKDFDKKEIFIYLTKVNSAKDNIYEKIIELNDEKIININFMQNIKNIDEVKIKNGSGEGGKYNIEFEYNGVKKEIKIGTIDSFIFALYNHEYKGNSVEKNYFIKMIQNLANGNDNAFKKTYIDKNIVKYCNKDQNKNEKDDINDKNKLKLCQKIIIIIDESQDLETEYLYVLSKIIKKTNIDVYIVGDILQTLYTKKNMHRYLFNINEFDGIKIIKSNNINHVRRFCNEKFKDFVNNRVNFEKYELSKIEKVGEERSYRSKNIPYDVFNIIDHILFKKYNKPDGECVEDLNIYMNKIDEMIIKIKSFIDDEIDRDNMLPNDFGFIFPNISNNFIANKLALELNEFWSEKFRNNDYRERVKKKYDNFYLNKISGQTPVEIHYSEEGKAVNLTTSIDKTRFLSIHASKGLTFSVVFLMGITENYLKKFGGYNNDNDSIIYDSLFHVMITRQRYSLYIGLLDNGDNIYKKFKSTENINISFISDNLSLIKKNTNLEEIKDDIFINSNLYNIIINEFKLIYNYEKYKYCFNLKQYENDIESKPLIDWGQHVIRYNIILYEFIKCIFDDNIQNISLQHIYNIYKLISTIKIEQRENANSYHNLIKSFIGEKNKYLNKKSNNIFIPILEYRYHIKFYIYVEFLLNTINNIKNKINIELIKNKKMPKLCVIEIIILMHMIDLYTNPINHNLTILNVYEIIDHYNSCDIKLLKADHEKYNCNCMKFLKNNNSNDKNNYITHYDKIQKIEDRYKKIKNKLLENYEIKMNENFYNTNMNFNLLNKNNNNFIIKNNYGLISHSKSEKNKYIINFEYTTQLSKINFDEKFIIFLLKEFLFNKCKDETKEENYFNKKPITCIYTLENDEISIIEFKCDNNKNIFKNIIKQFIIDKYSEYHKIIDKYFNNKIKEDTKKIPKEILKDIIEIIKNNAPEYIITKLKSYYDEKENDKIKDLFINNKLINKLDKILENKLEEFISSI